MAEDTVSRDEAGAAEWAHILGRSEDFGTRIIDDRPGYDEARLCNRCEHGHGGHVCAWCSGAAS